MIRDMNECRYYWLNVFRSFCFKDFSSRLEPYRKTMVKLLRKGILPINFKREPQKYLDLTSGFQRQTREAVLWYIHTQVYLCLKAVQTLSHAIISNQKVYQVAAPVRKLNSLVTHRVDDAICKCLDRFLTIFTQYLLRRYNNFNHLLIYFPF